MTKKKDVRKALRYLRAASKAIDKAYDLGGDLTIVDSSIFDAQDKIENEIEFIKKKFKVR